MYVHPRLLKGVLPKDHQQCFTYMQQKKEQQRTSIIHEVSSTELPVLQVLLDGSTLAASHAHISSRIPAAFEMSAVMVQLQSHDHADGIRSGTLMPLQSPQVHAFCAGKSASRTGLGSARPPAPTCVVVIIGSLRTQKKPDQQNGQHYFGW